MEKLPEEIWAIIFETTLIEDPKKLLQMRTVSKYFREIIDQYISSPKPWLKACSHIPDHVLDAIVRTKYPLNAFPWHEDYWKMSKSATKPRTIYLIWKNSESRCLKQKKSKKLSLLENRIYPQHIAINDRYLALVSGGTWSPNDVYVYALSNIQQCIRHYRITCDKIDFYSTKDQDFLILQEVAYSNTYKQIVNVHLAEFLVTRKLRDANLMDESFQFGPSNRYMIVENECFTISESTIRHKKLFRSGFYTATKFTLPKPDCRINNIRISGTELQILAVIIYEGEITVMSMFKFNLSRKDDGKLAFTPQTGDEFGQKIIPEISRTPGYIAFYNDMCDGPYVTTGADDRTIDASKWKVRNFCNRRILFNRTMSDWFKDVYRCEYRTAVLQGKDLFVGTGDERVFMFKWDPDELVEAMIRRRYPDLYSEKTELIPASGLHASVQWIRIKYIGLNLMVIAQTLDAIFTVVFTPTDYGR